MDQYLESPFRIAPPHEQILTTSLEHEVQLDDVIENIGRLRIDETTTPSKPISS